MDQLRVESGESAATLEQVFLRITEETEEERAARVALRFSGGSSAEESP
jgi:hypothetical protein